MITYAEKGDMAEFFFLVPDQSCYYTWIKPGGSRILTWAHDNQKDSMDFYENSLETDDQGHINLGKYKARTIKFGYVIELIEYVGSTSINYVVSAWGGG